MHCLEEDGSVAKVSFHCEEKVKTLQVGNYSSFLYGVGCRAVTPVKYHVDVRCLGCATERSGFHGKDGALFTGLKGEQSQAGVSGLSGAEWKRR